MTIVLALGFLVVWYELADIAHAIRQTNLSREQSARKLVYVLEDIERHVAAMRERAAAPPLRARASEDRSDDRG